MLYWMIYSLVSHHACPISCGWESVGNPQEFSGFAFIATCLYELYFVKNEKRNKIYLLCKQGLQVINSEYYKNFIFTCHLLSAISKMKMPYSSHQE